MIKYRFNLEENIVFFPGLVIEKQRLEGTIHKLCHEKVKLKKSPKNFIFYIFGKFLNSSEALSFGIET